MARYGNAEALTGEQTRLSKDKGSDTYNSKSQLQRKTQREEYTPAADWLIHQHNTIANRFEDAESTIRIKATDIFEYKPQYSAQRQPLFRQSKSELLVAKTLVHTWQDCHVSGNVCVYPFIYATECGPATFISHTCFRQQLCALGNAKLNAVLKG